LVPRPTGGRCDVCWVFRMIRHVAGIAEVVEDFDSAVSFYTDVLGLSVNTLSEGAYATVDIPGVLHYGIWSRKAAAEATFGNALAADRIPLGFSVGFEVDDVSETHGEMSAVGATFEHGPRTEPWKQITSRFMSKSGTLCELSSTPWARSITQQMRASEE
jgi:catechol 2,3-dioxygenase-like lactoylglutathione lyase family enzyme